MKIILLHIGAIHKYPPALSVLQSIHDLGHEVTLITTDINNETRALCNHLKIDVFNIEVSYENKTNLFLKFLRLFKVKKMIWNAIDKVYDEDSLIWIFSNESIKHIGKRIYNKRYIVHLFELCDSLLYTHKLPFLKINATKLCNNARKVIVCEYNRAYITMANWKLKELPVVLPNKPYNKVTIEKNSYISYSKEVRELLRSLNGRKIIIYQGLVSEERPLDEYIKAIDMLGEKYAFLIMSDKSYLYKNIKSKNCFLVPFIPPPYHLEVTSHAYIGILSYVPTNKQLGSPLNAIYCAPNKLYEYSMFGIPMLGNDIPGLSLVFNKYNCGKSVKQIKADEIYSTILMIEKNYENMSKNSRQFYESIDIKNVVADVIK